MFGKHGKAREVDRVCEMFELTAIGAVGLAFAIAALVGSIFVQNQRERRNLAQLDSLLDRLGVAEGAISVDQLAGDEADETDS